MKIKTLKLENFKGIKHETFHLDGKSTVFFGINGTGKSTALRGANILLSRIIQKVTHNRYKQDVNIEIDDIMQGEPYAQVSAVFDSGCAGYERMEFSYSRGIRRSNNHRYQDEKGLETIFKDFDTRYLHDEKANMPVFINYGVHRFVSDISLKINRKHTLEKISAFEKSIENRIDFTSFFEWFRNQEDYENEMKAHESPDYEDIPLKSVREAIYIMLDGFSNLRVQRNKLRMTIEKGNTTLDVNQLSDGEKCTLALIGDIARRLAIANPSMPNPCHGEGIVLIDEIELHMHPSWQRRIIPTLRHIFPNIQFLITTHSPQVLGEVKDDICIYALKKEDGIFLYDKIKSLVAWDSNLILEELMGTSSLNTDTKGKIARMFELVAKKQYDEAEKFADEIDDLSNGNNPDVMKARMLIARGKRHK